MLRKLYWFVLIGMFFSLAQPHQFKASENNVDNKLLQDTLLTTLDPYITEGVIRYYGYPKQYGLYDAKIVSIKRDSEAEFGFTVKVQVTTFEAAHNPPYGIETITFYIDPSGVKRINYNHKGDEDEKKIQHFYNEIISDIKQSFQLNLTSYTEYSYLQLQYKAEKDKEFKSLADITEEIGDNILNPEIHPPFKNIIDPVTFINGNEGYILFKRADGTNTFYKVAKDNKGWKVVEKKSTKGKKMKNDLLWYM